MLTSHTVENYLKAIFLAQVALLPSEQLVPLGQLASALGVVPGTGVVTTEMAGGGLPGTNPEQPQAERRASLCRRPQPARPPPARPSA